jgi:predicted phosphodiesterase
MVENDRLEQTFGPQPSYPYKYPYSLGYRRSEHISDTEAPSLIFFVFDSTASVIARQQNPLQRTPIYGAARGRIEHAECEWLVDEADRIAEKSQIAGLDGSEMSIQYDKAVRIALIHHYPVRANERLHLRDQTTLMEQSELFVEACLDARVDLVLFGHQHQTYRDERVKNGHRTYFFCCPSTAEYSAEDAGFYSFSFHEDYFQEALYCWRKPFFRLTENRTYGYSR